MRPRTKSRTNVLVFCTVWIAGIVLFDQCVKGWAEDALQHAPQATLPFIDGFIRFTYMENTGAAFSIFSGATWVLGVLSAALAGILIWVLYRTRTNPSLLLRLSLCFIVGGALGNVLDRLGRGYVIDMLDFQFMRFAVFNVADSFVCVGAVMFCVYIIFHAGKDLSKEDSGGDKH